jgi:hypothetical protein
VLLTSGSRPNHRYRLEAISDDENIIIFGGVNSKKDRFNDISIFRVDIKQYVDLNVTGDIPTGRSFHRIVLIDKLLFMFGGLDGERQNDLHVLNLDMKSIVR